MRIEYPLRLHLYLSKCGEGSRRYCETLIDENRVKINGKTVEKQGAKVYEKDIVTLDDCIVKPIRKMLYYALNKPKGYVCSNFDPKEKKYARDLIDINEKDLLFNVGRLDKDSQGLIFFTNDGIWANMITHPSFETEKEYIVKTNIEIKKEHLEYFLNNNSSFYKIKSYKNISKLEVQIILTEGKNREIRKMFSYFGYNVITLKRIRIGSVYIDNLQVGKYRKLNQNEINSFMYGKISQKN